MHRPQYALALMLIFCSFAAFARPTRRASIQDPRDDRPGLEGAHEAILERLEAFGTRNTMSNPDDPIAA